MTTTALARQQEEFMSLLLGDCQEPPEGLETRRVDIYRNAYRARLVDALSDTFPRTVRWVGDTAFDRAAAHHVISYPPSGWTLDAVGVDFPETLAGLFANDPEVSELAWLEWAMHLCFVSGDATPLDAAGFSKATAEFQENDWAQMRLRFMPGTQQRAVKHRVDRLWRALAEASTGASGTIGPETVDYSSDESLACIVWRQVFTPACIPVSDTEGRALARMLHGARYGDLCLFLIEELGEEAAAREAGVMLGRWLNEGMIVGVSLSASQKPCR